MRTSKGLAWLMVALALLAWRPAAATAAEVVKLGVILPYSGQGAQLADEMDKAIKLYIQEHEKELGDVKLEIVRRDSTGPAPDVARRLAQELITREHVQMLAGFVFTPNANAVAPLATEGKVPVVIMNATGANTLSLSPYMARTSFTKWQQVYPFGTWVANHGIKRVYMVVSDFVPGHESEAAFTKSFTAAGGKIVGAVRVPLSTQDFAPFLQRVKDEKPDAVFLFTPSGKDATAIIRGYVQLDMAKAGIQAIGASDVTPEDELPNMQGIPEGVITVGQYSVAGDRPANKAFVAAWHKAYGPVSVPDPYAVGAWDGMAAIFSAINGQHGKIDPDRTMDLLKHWKGDSPRGPVMIDPDTRQIVQNMYIRKLEKVDGKMANVEIETIPMVKDPWPQFAGELTSR